MSALFKVQNDNHIQHVISGEFGQGKSSKAAIYAKWDTIFTRRLLKIYKKEDDWPLKWGVNHMIISPKDPDSRYIFNPDRYNSYVVDDAYFFTSTADANTRMTKKIRNSIARNRKLNCSMYWIFPNFFKIPSSIRELMDIWTHSESLRIGDLIAPSRVIQIKEKFDQDRVEKYAKYPKFFPSLIRHHPSFVSKLRFPKVVGRSWSAYLTKYERYATIDDEEAIKESKKTILFNKLEKVYNSAMLASKNGGDRDKFIAQVLFQNMKKRGMNPGVASHLSKKYADEFFKWNEEKIAGRLTETLAQENTVDIDIEIGG